MPETTMYNVTTLAEYWGVSEILVYNLLNLGKLMGMRIGPKVLRIRAQWVLAYEQEHTTRPTEILEPDDLGERAARVKIHVCELRARE